MFKKFIAAHLRRSVTMTSQFLESVENGSFSVASARQFHQSMLVSLIEACKGITELYQGTSGDAEISSSSGLSQVEAEFYNGIQKTVQDYSKAVVKGFHAFFQQYHTIFRDVNLDLSPLNEEDLVSLQQELNIDLTRISPSPNHGAREGDDGDQQSSSARFRYQDERGSWLLLARQSILDVKYLDSTFTETCQIFVQISGKKRGMLGELFSANFADSLLAEIDLHTTFMRRHLLKSLVKDLLVSYPRHFAILDASEDAVQGICTLDVTLPFPCPAYCYIYFLPSTTHHLERYPREKQLFLPKEVARCPDPDEAHNPACLRGLFRVCKIHKTFS